MISITATQARSKLHQLLVEAAESHEPVKITSKRSNAVLISESDWRSIQGTLNLNTLHENESSNEKRTPP